MMIQSHDHELGTFRRMFRGGHSLHQTASHDSGDYRAPIFSLLSQAY
jgi:hypothetical protein